MSSTREEELTSQIVRTSRAEAAAVDWDAMVRQAFLEGCVQQGVRADLAQHALDRGDVAEREQDLRETLDDASRRAAVAWMAIESYLEQYGELAVMALERCIEEASLQVRRRSSMPAPASGVSRHLGDRDDFALTIIERGRERVARFWGSRDTSAA